MRMSTGLLQNSEGKTRVLFRIANVTIKNLWWEMISWQSMLMSLRFNAHEVTFRDFHLWAVEVVSKIMLCAFITIAGL